MRKIWARLFVRECEHPHTLVVTTVGVRRTICEDCGNVSFKMVSTGVSPRRAVQGSAPDLPRAEGL